MYAQRVSHRSGPTQAEKKSPDKLTLDRPSGSPSSLRTLQRSLGNEAMLRLSGSGPVAAFGDVVGRQADGAADHNVRRSPLQIQCQEMDVEEDVEEEEAIQAKLKVGRPDDAYEREADRVAEQVLHMPESASSPLVQRACLACPDEEEAVKTRPLPPQVTPLIQRQGDEEEEEGNVLQTKAPSGQVAQVAPDLSPRIGALRDTGRPLPAPSLGFFNSRFGYDFGGVRVHSGGQAAQMATALNARAFTVGRDVVFGDGQYAPGTAAGHRLLAHELTHVVQQSQNRNTAIQRYTDEERATCPCLDWSLLEMYSAARLMVGGGNITGRRYAAMFMDRFLREETGDFYVPFSDFQADAGGQDALDSVNATLSNQFLAEAEGLPCGGSRARVTKNTSVPGHFDHGTDLFYAMGAFTLRAESTGSVDKTCGADGNCSTIAARMDLRYRVDDLYDWKTDPRGCTPSTGETGCTANTKTVNLPLLGVICDECLNRLVIHGWASEFMVKVRGRASDYQVSGPCGFRNPTAEPGIRDNQREDP